MNKAKIDKLIDILAKDGYSKEQTVSVVTRISQMVVARVYNELLLQLNEEQRAIVDREKDDNEAEVIMAGFYLKNTGKEIEEVRKQVETDLISEFIDSYHKQKIKK